TLLDGHVHRLDDEKSDVFVAGEFKKLTLELGEGGRYLSRTVSSYRNDREMDMATMWSKVAAYEATADSLRLEAGTRWADFVERVLWAGEGRAAGIGDTQDLRRVSSRVTSDITLAGHKSRQAGRLRVEIHKKVSIPVACIVFVMVGAPLGISVRRGGAATGAALSIGFFLVYWVFLILGEKLADRAVIPPWAAMWSPNILLGLVGTGLISWLSRRGR
ncbi:LptF/LptG family permease, partial [bacterium]|nr:LptF/LptG family permease [bacterium]